ncbi:hypothetical protein H2200_009375 [Cladophialophora chaetospira]|uniref:Uncharacterized protein n=1 Tax=Cladophialophora chaetospira TaxID=386627 RepID=A0AA39CFJ5_9EURO|nr:hypothetical protein H2200_009375 [Cladophialophora chaetospira]
MAELNADQVAYMMVVLKNTEMAIDWKVITEEAGISKPSNAQRKFRQIVEAAGYKLVNNKIVESDSDTAAVTTPAATPTSKKRKASTKKDTNGETTRKRKGNQPASEPAGDEAAVKVEEEIKAEGAEGVE